MKENVFDDTKQRAFIENIIENEPPYKKIDFDVNWYTKLINVSDISINAFCDTCDAERVFTANIYNYLRNTIGKDVIRLPGGSVIPTSTENIKRQSLADRMQGKSYLLGFEMKCAKCGEIHYFSILLTESFVVKIGQFPSYAHNETRSVKKYKNLISKYYPELTRSINAYSQGMGVAAFVYLRRILEYLVEKKFTGDKSLKFSEKLHEVEKKEQIIPDELESIKNQIYSVLSKGVHEYEEDECAELYLAVRFVIERILDIELEKKNNQSKAKLAIAAINSKLKGENNG